MEIPALANEANLDAFVRAFEDGTFPGKDYHHAQHLVVAACYLTEHGAAEATARMRTNIRRYNEAQGGKNTEDAGYHETLTVFWLMLIAANLPEAAGRLEAARRAVELFGARRDVFRNYYSFDVLNSRDARSRWIAPDLAHQAPEFAAPVW